MTKTQRPQTQEHGLEQPRPVLRKETLRDLSAVDLRRVVGATAPTGCCRPD
jgi:hypothetical protein